MVRVPGIGPFICLDLQGGVADRTSAGHDLVKLVLELMPFFFAPLAGGCGLNMMGIDNESDQVP